MDSDALLQAEVHDGKVVLPRLDGEELELLGEGELLVLGGDVAGADGADLVEDLNLPFGRDAEVAEDEGGVDACMVEKIS